MSLQNFVRSITLASVFFGCLVAEASAGYVLKNLELRTSGTGAYSTSLNASGSGTNIDFRIGVLTDGSEPSQLHRASLSLPLGLVQNGYTAESVDCTTGITNVVQNTNTFAFDFPGGPDCEVIVRAKYRTTGVSNGAYQPSFTVSDSTDGIFLNGNDDLTSSNQVTLTVSSLISITRAITRDNNNDGFLDRFDLTLSSPAPASAPVGPIKISADLKTATGITFVATPGSLTGALTFADGNFIGKELPHIEIPADANYIAGDYFTQIVEDGAAPKLTASPIAGAYTGSKTVTLSSTESGSIYYTFTGSANTGSTLYSTSIVINSNRTLSAYTRDIWGNVGTGSFVYTFGCPIAPPANSTLAAYPGCAIVCNAGYQLNGSVCEVIPSSGGGGGGGGWVWGGGPLLDACPYGDTSGSPNDGRCTPLPTSTGSTSTGTTSTGSNIDIPGNNGGLSPTSGLGSSTLDRPYFTSLDAARDYLYSQVKDATIRKQIDSYYTQLAFADGKYYLSFDADLAKTYNRAINAYVLYILRTEDVRAGKDVVNARNEANKALTVLTASLTTITTRDTRYVTIVKTIGKYKAYIYRTKQSTLTKSLRLTEFKYLPKIKRLAITNNLDQKGYLAAIETYNRYVLNTTIAVRFTNSAAATRAAVNKAELDRLALIKPVIKPTLPQKPVVTPPVVIPPTKVADLYEIKTDLAVGKNNLDVFKLQTILKHYGYFDIAQTNYFGDYTKKALIKFSSEKLKINNPNGVFDSKVRNATMDLTW